MSISYQYSAGTGAIIMSPDGSQVLLIEEHKAPGKWGIVGGKLEPMPSVANLTKEILEETGYRVRVDKLIRVYQRYDCDPQRISFIYRVTAMEQVAAFDHREVKRIAWFDIADVPWSALRFDDNAMMIRDALTTDGFSPDVIVSLPNVT